MNSMYIDSRIHSLLKDKTATPAPLDSLFLALAMFFWLSYFPVAVVSIWKALKNRRVFIEKDLEGVLSNAAIVFQITTRSATKTTVVKRGIPLYNKLCTQCEIS